MPWNRRLLAFAALLLASAAVLALLLAPGKEADPLARYRQQLRIGYAYEPPYSFRTGDGMVTGEAPEVAKHVALVLGMRNIKWILMDFGSLIGELEAGHIDVIAAGMFVTPERAGRVRFSRPTAVVEQGLLVAAGNPRRLHSYEGVVRAPGVRAAVLEGAVEKQMLEALGMPPERLFAAREAGAALSALNLGRVECLALSRPTVQYLALGSRGFLEVAQPFIQPTGEGRFGPMSCALAFRKDDKELAEAFDAVLAGFIGSAEHLKLVAPLGFGASTMPSERP